MVPHKWRNGTAPSVDKIKGDDKSVSLQRHLEKEGCVTVVCRVTRVITVARLLARTLWQKTKCTLTAILSCVHLGYTTGAHCRGFLRNRGGNEGIAERGEPERTFFDVESIPWPLRPPRLLSRL